MFGQFYDSGDLTSYINKYAPGSDGNDTGAYVKNFQGILDDLATRSGATVTPTSPTSATPVSSQGCSGSAASGTIAGVAKEMGAWGAQYQACYKYGGGHGTDTEWMKRAIAAHFTGEYAVDCSAFVRAVIIQATGKDPGDNATESMCTSPSYTHVDRASAQVGDITIQCTGSNAHTEVITAMSGTTITETVGSHSDGCGAGKGASSTGAYQGTESYVLRFNG
jgi:hypothetical protein